GAARVARAGGRPARLRAHPSAAACARTVTALRSGCNKSRAAGRGRASRPYLRPMPPRPHPLVLASLAFACVIVLVLVIPRGAAGATDAATWRWPLRGPVVGPFRVLPRAPFARGQRRGIDVSA